MKSFSVAFLVRSGLVATVLGSCALAQGFNVDISGGFPAAGALYPEHPLATFGAAAGQPGHWNTVAVPTNYPVPSPNPVLSFGLRDSTGAFTTVSCSATYPATNPAVENWGSKDMSASPLIQVPGPGWDPSMGSLMLDFQLLPLSATTTNPVTYAFTGLGAGFYDVYTYSAWTPGTPPVTSIDVNGIGAQLVSNSGGLYSPTGIPSFALGVSHSRHRVYLAPGAPLVVTAITAVDGQYVGTCANYPLPWPGCTTGTGAALGGNVSGIQIVPAPMYESFCNGDYVTTCPCLNVVAPGTVSGCVNSFGYGASLTGAGVPSISANTLVLNGVNLGNNNPALTNTAKLLASTSSSPVAAQFMDDGALCLTGSIIRLGNYTTVGGAVSVPVPAQVPNGSGQQVPILPGQVFYYQMHYRDANSTYCTSGLGNTTNAVAVYWIP